MNFGDGIVLEKTGIALTLRNVCRHMPALAGSGEAAIEIVTEVDLEVRAGETCAVVGASGSGKTTLLGIMAGMDQPDNGEVLLHAGTALQQSLYTLSEEQRAQIRARDMGFVFQNFQLVADMHALDNVMLSLELAHYARGHQLAASTVRKTASEWLERVGLASRLFHFPRQLSGGEQQRVALARAFACEPGILFADEPTGSLDENTAREMIELLFSLNRDTGSTMILVTHDASLATRCDSVYRLANQRLARNGLGVGK